MHKVMRAILAACVIQGTALVGAEQTTLQELAVAVGDRVLPFSELEPRYVTLVDCETTPISVLDENRSGYSDLHHIHKWMFTWNIEQTDQGTCVTLRSPSGGLSRNEAQLFLGGRDDVFAGLDGSCLPPISETIPACLDDGMVMAGQLNRPGFSGGSNL
ncbi:hypothetical protein [Dokdonella sp.]|uniref:hypothetical protein n=1 Tax=Dokdonella sp. TaxID=2291710 RepID=UPI00352748D5